MASSRQLPVSKARPLMGALDLAARKPLIDI
jgi:hypothetical protein